MFFLSQTMTTTRKLGKFYIFRTNEAIKRDKGLAGHQTNCQVHVQSKSLIETRLSRGLQRGQSFDRVKQNTLVWL